MSRESWRFVPGFEGRYQVSDQGRFRSVDREETQANGVTRKLRGLPLRLNLNSAGYLCARLGRQTMLMVHVAVAAAFLGPRPVGNYVRHKSKNKLDNRLSNLCYGTPADNQKDRKRHGTYLAGDACPQAKLSTAQVRSVKRALASGRCTHAAIAEKYGVTRGAISAIASGRNWAHVKE